MSNRPALLCSVVLSHLLPTAIGSIQAQEAPALVKPTARRVRVDDQERMQQLTREGEKLLKAGKTSPFAKLQAGLKKPHCRVDVLKPSDTPLAGAALYKQAHDSVVVISSLYYCNRCTRLHATVAGGVMIGQSGEVLTNEHVIRGRPDQKRETIVAMTGDGRVIPVREVLAASRRDDLAVIRLDTKAGQLPTPLPLGTNPLPGTPIRVMSHPNNHFFHFSDGIIARYFRESGPGGPTRVMSITADYGRGSSGCPVLDTNGNIVGLVSRTSSLYYRQTKQKQENLQMVFKLCVSASRITPLITGKPQDVAGK